MTTRHYPVLLLTLACACLVPVAGRAQTVDDVVARHLAARGGLDRIRAIQSLRMTGRATTNGESPALITREVQRPGRIRIELSYQGVTAAYVSDGESGWQVSPFDGSLDPEPMAPEQMQVARDQSDIDGPFVDSTAKGLRVELAGKAPLDGRDAYKLKVTTKDGAVRHHYVDAVSHLLVRSEATRPVRGRMTNVETTFSDYREVAGVMFPHAIETGASGRATRMRIVVDRVEVNPPLDAARFRAPEGLGAAPVKR